MSEIVGPVHLVGIGGVHMSAIALLLLERGVAVAGSDLRLSEMTEKVRAAGAVVYEGHAAENVGDDVALVVTTAAAGDDNPEIAEARRRDIPVILRAEMVARLMEGKRVIAVAGAHGKTTTSSLIALILREAGLDPMYLLGGESVDLHGHAAWGHGDLCVVEADEYKRAFLEYSPSVAVITNVEPDHLDYYGTEAAYRGAFVDFARRIVEGGRLLACWDDTGAREASEMVEDEPISVESYGMEGARFWLATDVQIDQDGTRFTVRRGGAALGVLHSRTQFGKHFVRNALAAAAVCYGLDVPFGAIRDAVEQFHGATRRFQDVGSAGGVLVKDDYAHHPDRGPSDHRGGAGRVPGATADRGVPAAHVQPDRIPVG